jgi:uncharacterized protein GlcG (DUF336 family)
MAQLTLALAQQIIARALAHAREAGFKPLGVVVLDARGALKAYAAEDGTSLARAQIAIGKASGAVAMGMGSRAIATRPPAFLSAVGALLPNGMIPVPGGVLIRADDGEVLGAVGVSGDTADNDEAAALAGISAAGLRGEAGATA